MILCDTAPIVASALSTDDDHDACVELFTGMHLAGRDLLVPATVVAEVGHLLAREAGARVEALFLTALAVGDFQTVDLTATDYRRMAELVEQYADFPLGTTDASSSHWPSASTFARSPPWTGATSPSSGPGTSPR